jgi:hypothetical protein
MMTIDPLSLVLIGLCVVVAYLIWDKMRMDAQIDHIIEQHNGLCSLFSEFVEHVEEEFERVEEQQND